MIIGIGLDLIELKRIKALVDRQPAFVNRILTSEEEGVYITLSKKRKIEFLAGRFCAKEAFAKAVGSGIGENLSFKDIKILNNSAGKPVVESEKFSQRKIHLSITHTAEYAAAQVIIEQ
ncbi:holo-ACP synthase [Evansella sp. AB-P1]|uniref:holo-ACP synthase n=1 Tax=Evansella sp. AB-P1 TaxID=3037653 RepID=UPI00241EAA06|nr:holo-ACP synthase [Evansella sp. AB-P1]MDG5787947.1 holo-ACP synthase [Evansella sp. AB-P1]